MNKVRVTLVFLTIEFMTLPIQSLARFSTIHLVLLHFEQADKLKGPGIMYLHPHLQLVGLWDGHLQLGHSNCIHLDTSTR